MSAIPVLTNSELLSILSHIEKIQLSYEPVEDDGSNVWILNKSELFTRIVDHVNLYRDSNSSLLMSFITLWPDHTTGYVRKVSRHNRDYYLEILSDRNFQQARFQERNPGGRILYIARYQIPYLSAAPAAGAGSGSAASAAPAAGSGSGSAASAAPTGVPASAAPTGVPASAAPSVVPSAGAGSGSAASAAPGGSTRELEALKDRITCSICLEREKNTRLNCGHMICDTCAASISLCPICRAPITSRDRVYLGGYKQKYLKYKQKYLDLKNQIF